MITLAAPESMIPICFFGGFIIFVALMIIVGALTKDQRKKALVAWASERRLQYVEEDPMNIPQLCQDFSLMQQGDDRKASHVMWGLVGEAEVTIFAYEYTTEDSDDDETTWHHQCCLWRLPADLGSMQLRPEGFFDRISSWLGSNDIDFESEEFSRRFHVTGDDRRLVYDVVTPRMMEHLLAVDPQIVEVSGSRALTYKSGSVPEPEVCDAFVHLAEGFNRNVPEHVIRDRQAREER